MIRRRQAKDDTKEEPADETASISPAASAVKVENETTVATQTPELVRGKPAPTSKRIQVKAERNKKATWLIFLLGGALGIFGALFFAKQQEVIKFDSLADLNLDSFMDALPSAFVKDMKQFSVCALITLKCKS